MPKKDTKKELKNFKDAYTTFIQGVPASKIDEFRQRVNNTSNKLINLLGNNLNNKNVKSMGPNEEVIKLIFAATKLNNKNTNNDLYKKKDFVEDDLAIIDILGSDFKNAFLLMDEYKIIEELIPMIGRVTNMIVKDIINVDPLTKKSIYNIYKYTDETEEEQRIIDEFINDALVDINFETKSKKWITQSLISGCNPVVVIPLKSIIKSATKHFNNIENPSPILSLEDHMDDNFKVTDSAKFTDQLLSLESSEFNKLVVEKNLFTLDESSFSEEELKFDRAKIEQAFIEENKILDNILTQDILREADSIISNEILNIKKQYYNHNTKSSRSEKEINNNIKELGLEDFNNSESYTQSDTYEHLKKILKPIVEATDKKVSFTIPGLSSVVAAKKVLKRMRKLNKRCPNTFDDIEEVKEDSLEPSDIFNYLNVLSNKENSLFNSEIVILDLEPEKVIPIISNKEHIGYFIIEDENIISENENRSRNTFGNILKSLGMDNDEAVMGIDKDNTLSGLNPTTNNLSGCISVFNNINLNNESRVDTDSDKYSLIEKIVSKTIASKLPLDDLYDDRTFRNSIAVLLKKGILVNSDIRYTYVPAYNMVYYSNQIDDNGMPVSIMKGTLLFTYLYLSSIMSNYMIKTRKGSGKEVQEIDIGKTKQVGLSVATIDKLLSTQTLDSSVFSGGIMNVIKTAGTSKKYIIPSINDNMLYNVRELEQPDFELDDDWTEKLLNQTISRMTVPPYVLGDLNENEFARSISSRDLEYLMNIINKQSNFSEFNTKLIKLVLKYKLSTTKNKILKEKFSINKISANYSMPTGLLIQNLSDSFENVKSMSETIAELFLEGTDGPADERVKGVFGLKLFRHFITTIGIEWEDVNEMFNSSYDEVLNNLSISRMIKNREYEVKKTKIEELEIKKTDEDEGDNY